MNIKKVIELSSNPKPYDKGTAIMRTDKHISKELLKFHLDTSSDTASRDRNKIEGIVNAIDTDIASGKCRILDLGCGPGLYAERFHNLGYDVTGIDFSQNSIDYAARSAKEKGLNINYICQNYLNIDYESEYDVITMIYCDFGVLSLSE